MSQNSEARGNRMTELVHPKTYAEKRNLNLSALLELIKKGNISVRTFKDGIVKINPQVVDFELEIGNRHFETDYMNTDLPPFEEFEPLDLDADYDCTELPPLDPLETPIWMAESQERQEKICNLVKKKWPSLKESVQANDINRVATIISGFE